MPPSAAPLPVVPQEVLAFAQEQGAAAYLPAVLELTQRIFPTARRIALVVEQDPGIPDERYIVIDVDVSLTVQEDVAADGEWCLGAQALCPIPLLGLFRLCTHLGA
jgi:hypothetical protein